MQVGDAPHPADVPGVGQRRRHHHWIGRLAPAVQVEDRLEDDGVGWAVEVGGPQNLDHISDRVFGEQHAPEYALLGGDVLRWSAVKLRIAAAGPVLRWGPYILRDRHLAPF